MKKKPYCCGCRKKEKDWPPNWPKGRGNCVWCGASSPQYPEDDLADSIEALLKPEHKEPSCWWDGEYIVIQYCSDCCVGTTWFLVPRLAVLYLAALEAGTTEHHHKLDLKAKAAA